MSTHKQEFAEALVKKVGLSACSENVFDEGINSLDRDIGANRYRMAYVMNSYKNMSKTANSRYPVAE
jgi:hypothetical protein